LICFGYGCIVVGVSELFYSNFLLCVRDISCFGLIVQDSGGEGQAELTEWADRQQKDSQPRDGKLLFVVHRKH